MTIAAAEQLRRVLNLTLVGIAGGDRRVSPAEWQRLLAQHLDDLAQLGGAQAAQLLSTGNIRADLACLPAGLPIQVIVGEADVITPPAINLEIAAAISAASVRVVPGAGHAAYLEKPHQFNRLLAEFVAADAAT